MRTPIRGKMGTFVTEGHWVGISIRQGRAGSTIHGLGSPDFNAA
ncbi:hypothetical protein [Paenibacillus rigui]|nr:hypothetical protein [Paenibacillus rigui]